VDRTNEGDEEVTLDWDDNTEADLAGYNIYRRDYFSTGPYTQLNTYLVTVSAYTDTSVEEDRLYHYWVTAVDTNGNESAYSNRVEAKTLC
jgi:fibronectin type 3 domain-containing protein